MQIKCKYVNGKRAKSKKILEIQMITPKPKVWVGMDKMNENMSNYSGSQSAFVKRAIRHELSYKGGGNYGSYGGYDIGLLELDTPIHAQLACLPVFVEDTDIKAEIAGYGTDRRKNCLTNEFGFSKHHYCKNENGCSKNRPPPQDEFCDQFFSKVDNWSEAGKYDEVMIMRGRKPTFCHQTQNPENSNFGWCNTGNIDYYSFSGTRMSQDGWGYCSKDCYLDESYTYMGQVLRHEYVHVSTFSCLKTILANFGLGFR